MELLVVLHDSFDLRLRVIEVLHALLADHMLRRSLVAMVLADVPPAVLTRNDIGIEVSRRVWVHTIPDVGAELDEEDLPTSVLVDLLKLCHGLGFGEVEAKLLHASLELPRVDAAVITSVHAMENLIELTEPEHVQQQGVELRLLHPVITIAILENGLLVSAHEGRLVVDEGRPRTTIAHLNSQLVDLSEAHNVVAVEVQSLPQGLQAGHLDEAVLAHVGVQCKPKLHELVLRRRHRRALDIRVRAPFAVLVTAGPSVRAARSWIS
mmetsp:Transcript_77744/g.200146  ORF Transcript_77744/g.200146 Transcript_77744/m.200146 type:complete len:266 (+) Transcript_77744:649-1446(+)